MTETQNKDLDLEGLNSGIRLRLKIKTSIWKDSTLVYDLTQNKDLDLEGLNSGI